jgi:hypothetical protein
VNSAAEIGSLSSLFPHFYSRHSTIMKFVQFHHDNTNSTYETTNCCGLTFLEQIFPTLNSRIENCNYKTHSICHGFTVTSNSTHSRSEFARTNIKSEISHHLAKFLNFPMNLTTKIGAFSQFRAIVVTFYHGHSAT